MKIYAYQHKNKLNPSQQEKMLSVLLDSEKEKVFSFKRAIDAEISLISRFLLRQILSSILNKDPDQVEIFYNEYKRPFIKEFDFNVSHAADWIVIAVNKKGRVGIDVEKIRKVEESLIDTCFVNEEKKYILENGVFDLERFFELWTLKESFIKADGKGLSYPLKDFYFNLERDIEINFKNNEKKTEWYFSFYQISPEYKLSLCCDTKNFPEKICYINKLEDFSHE